MGIFGKAKDALTGGSSDEGSSDDIAEDWTEDIDSEVQESDEMLDGEETGDVEPVEEEWDTAYQFAAEFLELKGFASMTDFTNKCMAYKINQSPLYRDRVSNGVDTMNQIATMQDQMRRIQGGDSNDEDWGQKAEKMKQANQLIDQAEKLNGKEDAMVNELIGVGHELANSIAEGGINPGGNRDVSSDVNQSNERL